MNRENVSSFAPQDDAAGGEQAVAGPVDVRDILTRAPLRLACLQAVRDLGLPDAWIGAGFIRNAVWDALTGRAHDPRAHDVDVVFFDAALTSEPEAIAAERRLEQTLAGVVPGLDWSVTNQARMATRNVDRPYRDTADAIAHWPETATAVAAQVDGAGGIRLLAPHGLDDLLALVVRPTPAFADKPAIWEKRCREKAWQSRWPEVRFLPRT
ncbi:MAG: nucleotidyltransferase family protein [Minicystis sp.]